MTQNFVLKIHSSNFSSNIKTFLLEFSSWHFFFQNQYTFQFQQNKDI